MHEDVHKQLPLGPEPRGDPRQELLVVLHVLEHLHRHHAVKRPRLVRRKHVHVGRHHGEVGDAPGRRLGLDVLPLGAAVAHGRDPRPGVPLRHVQREGAPAAAQLQDVLPVRQAGALAREGQHGLLRTGQVVAPHPGRVVARAVLEAGAEAQLVQGGGHLVMLLVGLARLLGHSAAAEVLHKGHVSLRLLLVGAPGLARDADAEQVADGGADGEVGDHIQLGGPGKGRKGES